MNPLEQKPNTESKIEETFKSMKTNVFSWRREEYWANNLFICVNDHYFSPEIFTRAICA